MSIMRCDECERQVDTDFEEMEQVEDANLCIPCYKNFCNEYGDQVRKWEWQQQDQDQEWINGQQ